MTDNTSFAAGSLFTRPRNSRPFCGRNTGASGSGACRVPHDGKPKEATTEKDAIWPIMAMLGWDEYLTQQNLSVTCRVDVPDGLLFIDVAAKAKAKANAHPDEWKR